MSKTSVFPNYTTPNSIPYNTLSTESRLRVFCLYRVSTAGQVDHTENDEADIPMQRLACHRFVERMGWQIVYEEQEEGVSGHKVRAENRDKIQLVKEYAKQKKFDVFLVFMFDRIGRIADETPFVVEWLINNGIRVWSTQEGEQRIESHTDRLTNYIRYWQADGESQKTSVRTSTRMGQITEEGHFTGGVCPYGYKLVKLGRTNKKGVELSDLAINEDEAPVVRMIFEKYVTEGYGPQRIANYLRQLSLKNRDGKNWHPATIRGILRNLTYTGVLRSGKSRSPVIMALQIIDEQTFLAAQEISGQRSGKYEETRNIPLNTRGNSLIAGNVFCGHCGARLSITTSGKGRRRADGTDYVRTRYTCQTKSRTHGDCDGQTGYTAHILDGIIDDLVHEVFRKVGGFSQSEAIQQGSKKKLNEKRALVRRLQREAAKTEKDLHNLRNEIMKALDGSSAFSPEVLSGLIKEQEGKFVEQSEALELAQRAADESGALAQEMERQYDQFVAWAYVYDTANMETRKMIVSQIFERIEVYRDYKLKVQFTITVEQFLKGLNMAA